MNARRFRALLSSIIVSSGVILLTVGPGAAATCTLAAPASVAIGTALSISGTGFPANTGVDVSITIDGGAPDTFTAQSDAGGAFSVDLTPEASEAGSWTVVATAGAGCSGQVVIEVGTPNPTPEPSSDGGAAGETAGEAAGATAPPPTTDTASALTGTAGQGTAIWLGLVLLALGIGGLIVTKPVRSR